MDLIIRWFEQTTLYQGFLAKLPSPLNNVYFDVLVFGTLLIYIIYCIVSRIVDAVAFARLRKRSQEFSEKAEGEQAQGNEGGNRHLANGSGTCLPAKGSESVDSQLEARIETMNRQFEDFRQDREEEISRLQSRLDEVQEGDNERKREVSEAIEELRAQIEDLKEVKEKETAELKEKAEEVSAEPENEEMPEEETCVDAASTASESTQAPEIGADVNCQMPEPEEQAEQGISDFDRLLLEYEKTNELIAEIEGRASEKPTEGQEEKPIDQPDAVQFAEAEEPEETAAEDDIQPAEQAPVKKRSPRKPKVSDEDVSRLLIEAAGCAEPKDIGGLEETEKVAAVQAALAAGASIRQIAEITGISRSGVQRLSKKAATGEPEVAG